MRETGITRGSNNLNRCCFCLLLCQTNVCPEMCWKTRTVNLLGPLLAALHSFASFSVSSTTQPRVWRHICFGEHGLKTQANSFICCLNGKTESCFIIGKWSPQSSLYIQSGYFSFGDVPYSLTLRCFVMVMFLICLEHPPYHFLTR